MTKEAEINILIGKRIVLLRNQKNLTRSKLARILNITHQQLNKYEKGINRISAAKLSIICQEFELYSSFFYADLITQNNITENIKDDLNTLIAYFIQIKKNSKREAIINLIKELVL